MDSFANILKVNTGKSEMDGFLFKPICYILFNNITKYFYRLFCRFSKSTVEKRYIADSEDSSVHFLSCLSIEIEFMHSAV